MKVCLFIYLKHFFIFFKLIKGQFPLISSYFSNPFLTFLILKVLNFSPFLIINFLGDFSTMASLSKLYRLYLGKYSNEFESLGPFAQFEVGGKGVYGSYRRFELAKFTLFLEMGQLVKFAFLPLFGRWWRKHGA